MNKVLHLLGIVSFYSSHGSIDHLKALMKMAEKEGITNLYIHSILGRRGEKPESGAIYIQDIEKECEKLNLGRVVTVIGRHWVLDREENWDRIEKSYRTLVHGEGNRVIDGEYKRN
jgi:2,3-bisphosphoglycerate-independent phosphoglycerate mutase